MGNVGSRVHRLSMRVLLLCLLLRPSSAAAAQQDRRADPSRPLSNTQVIRSTSLAENVPSFAQLEGELPHLWDAEVIGQQSEFTSAKHSGMSALGFDGLRIDGTRDDGASITIADISFF